MEIHTFLKSNKMCIMNWTYDVSAIKVNKILRRVLWQSKTLDLNSLQEEFLFKGGFIKTLDIYRKLFLLMLSKLVCWTWRDLILLASSSTSVLCCRGCLRPRSFLLNMYHKRHWPSCACLWWSWCHPAGTVTGSDIPGFSAENCQPPAGGEKNKQQYKRQ